MAQSVGRKGNEMTCEKAWTKGGIVVVRLANSAKKGQKLSKKLKILVNKSNLRVTRQLTNEPPSPHTTPQFNSDLFII